MANSILGISTYYNAFVSPFQSYQVNPNENLIYGAMANKMYTQNVSKKVQSSVSSYLSSLNSSISNLKLSARTLASKSPDSSYSQKAVSTTDSSAVTGTAASNADLAAYKLNVSKLANSQVNTGLSVNSNAKSAVSQGANTFSLNLGSNGSKKISFSVDGNDTNKSSLDKMAKAINSAKAIESDINNFVKSYNSTVSFASGSASTIKGAGTLFDEFNNIAKSKKSSLEGIGITANPDGILSINSSKLEKAIGENLSKVKDVFSGNDGIAEKVYNKSNDVLSSPLKYSQPNEGSFSSLYSNISASSPLLYSKNLYAGLIVDAQL